MRPPKSRELEALQARVDEWRLLHGGSGSIVPEGIWASAVKVARKDGIHVTSRALRLGYDRLKRRVQAAGHDLAPLRGLPPKSDSKTPTFVELSPGALATSASKTVLELFGDRGRRMRIDVAGSDSMDLLALSTAFWRSEK